MLLLEVVLRVLLLLPTGLRLLLLQLLSKQSGSGALARWVVIGKNDACDMRSEMCCALMCAATCQCRVPQNQKAHGYEFRGSLGKRSLV